MWSRVQASNPRPSLYRSVALPTELTRPVLCQMSFQFPRMPVYQMAEYPGRPGWAGRNIKESLQDGKIYFQCGVMALGLHPRQPALSGKKGMRWGNRLDDSIPEGDANPAKASSAHYPFLRVPP